MPNHLRRVALGVSIGILGLLPGACSTHKAPTFRVIDAQLASRTESASTILVTIEGENPNRDELPLYAVHYRASVDGETMMSGVERSPQRTLPRFSTGSFTIPVIVPNERLGGPVARVSIDGSVVYQVPGTIAQVFFDNEIRRPRAPVHGEHAVNLSATVPLPG
ncbi:MAG: LEA type 2 family protein [Phycisphaerales bacterium]|nr:LEA type 2 family protein [Phycisphaerales bacterium]